MPRNTRPAQTSPGETGMPEQYSSDPPQRAAHKDAARATSRPAQAQQYNARAQQPQGVPPMLTPTAGAPRALAPSRPPLNVRPIYDTMLKYGAGGGDPRAYGAEMAAAFKASGAKGLEDLNAKNFTRAFIMDSIHRWNANPVPGQEQADPAALARLEEAKRARAAEEARFMVDQLRGFWRDQLGRDLDEGKDEPPPEADLEQPQRSEFYTEARTGDTAAPQRPGIGDLKTKDAAAERDAVDLEDRRKRLIEGAKAWNAAKAKTNTGDAGKDD